MIALNAGKRLDVVGGLIKMTAVILGVQYNDLRQVIGVTAPEEHPMKTRKRNQTV